MRRARLGRVLAALEAPALRWPERLRLTRGIQALEWIGTATARGVLEKLESSEARAALARLSERE